MTAVLEAAGILTLALAAILIQPVIWRACPSLRRFAWPQYGRRRPARPLTYDEIYRDRVSDDGERRLRQRVREEEQDAWYRQQYAQEDRQRWASQALANAQAARDLHLQRLRLGLQNSLARYNYDNIGDVWIPMGVAGPVSVEAEPAKEEGAQAAVPVPYDGGIGMGSVTAVEGDTEAAARARQRLQHDAARFGAAAGRAIGDLW